MKFQEFLTEKAMGKKDFKRTVAKIGKYTEANDSPKMRKLWDKWDKKVGGRGDLYVDEILWRVYDSKKMWDQFVADWQKAGFPL